MLFMIGLRSSLQTQPFGKRSFSYLAPTVLIADFRHFQTPCENSPFQIAHQHPYHAAHLVTASASDSVSLLNVCAL